MAAPGVIESVQNYARGICGGLLFSLPMLYTQEMWWAGVQLHPLRQAAYLLACLVLLFAYNRLMGLRANLSLWGVACDAVESLGLGLLLSYLLLNILEPFEPGEVPAALLGKTVMEGGLFGIGISVGKAQLGATADEEGLEGEGDEVSHSWFGQVVFAICGAVLVAASIGPVDEVTLLADIAPWRLLLLAALSLVLSVVVLYFSNFRQAAESAPRTGVLDMLFGGLLSYALALVVAGLILYFFGKLDNQSYAASLDQIVVLALPASLGASAGRLLLQYQ